MRRTSSSDLPLQSFPFRHSLRWNKGAVPLGDGWITTCRRNTSSQIKRRSGRRYVGDVIKSIGFPLRSSFWYDLEKVTSVFWALFFPPPREQGQCGPSCPLRCHEDKFTVICKVLKMHKRSTREMLNSFSNKSTILKLPGGSNYVEPGYVYEGRHGLWDGYNCVCRAEPRIVNLLETAVTGTSLPAARGGGGKLFVQDLLSCPTRGEPPLPCSTQGREHEVGNPALSPPGCQASTSGSHQACPRGLCCLSFPPKENSATPVPGPWSPQQEETLNLELKTHIIDFLNMGSVLALLKGGPA